MGKLPPAEGADIVRNSVCRSEQRGANRFEACSDNSPQSRPDRGLQESPLERARASLSEATHRLQQAALGGTRSREGISAATGPQSGKRPLSERIGRQLPTRPAPEHNQPLIQPAAIAT